MTRRGKDRVLWVAGLVLGLAGATTLAACARSEPAWEGQPGVGPLTPLEAAEAVLADCADYAHDKYDGVECISTGLLAINHQLERIAVAQERIADALEADR